MRIAIEPERASFYREPMNLLKLKRNVLRLKRK